MVKPNILPGYRLILVVLVIAITSLEIGLTNRDFLEHTRLFTRSMNYHLLGHNSLDIYWTGQYMINYPINEYQTLLEFNDMLGTFMSYLRDFNMLIYATVDQAYLNGVEQTLIVDTLEGPSESYKWSVKQGFVQPFQIGNISTIRATFIRARAVQILMEPIMLGSHKWHIQLIVEPFSDTSLVARLYLNETINMSYSHMLTLLLGLLLLLSLTRSSGKSSLATDTPLYFLSFFLLYSGAMSFSSIFSFEWVFIADGVACLSAWLCLVTFYSREKDFHMAKIIGKSYRMIGRLFLSFLPLFLAFSLLGYCLFCRYSGQFSSFWRTVTSLFYICYYNMTYESMVVTSRSSWSIPFFMIFVLIFTICIYSGMLVSVFCNYVWSKREAIVEKDILDSLQIQCSNCTHKYKYHDRLQKEQQKEEVYRSKLWMEGQKEIDLAQFKQMALGRMEYMQRMSEAFCKQNTVLYWGLEKNYRSTAIYKEMVWGLKRRAAGLADE